MSKDEIVSKIVAQNRAVEDIILFLTPEEAKELYSLLANIEQPSREIAAIVEAMEHEM